MAFSVCSRNFGIQFREKGQRRTIRAGVILQVAVSALLFCIAVVSASQPRHLLTYPHPPSHGSIGITLSLSRLPGPAFAFPDSRKHESQKKSRQSYDYKKNGQSSSKSNPRRHYKESEEEDVNGNASLIGRQLKNRMHSRANDNHGNQRDNADNRQVNEERSVNRQRENKRQRQRNNNLRRSGRNTKYNARSRNFTCTKVAPPLKPLQLPKSLFIDDNNNGMYINNDSNKDDYILSPSVIERNQEECMTYVCGELPVTYTNEAKTIERWLADNCSYTFKTSRNEKTRSKEKDQKEQYFHDTYDSNLNSHSFLGFDTESFPTIPWKKPINPEFKNRPATVQLSTPYSSIVIHLTGNANASHLKPLQAILSDPTVLKVGAGIDEDMLDLYRYNSKLCARSRFDIGGIGSSSKRNRVGLQKLVRAIVGVELPKSKKITMSDWSKIPLDERQLMYASRDAWAGAAVMENLGRMYGDEMHVDSIAALLAGERDMADIDSRARRRKESKMQVKAIIAQMKEYSVFLNSGNSGGRGDRDGKRIGRGSYYNQQEDMMPDDVKQELGRLRNILDETSPDGLIFFDADSLGLDFSFVE